MSSRRRRRGAGHGNGGGGGHGDASSRWLVSYADFITLMFVVFLVLFAMARVDSAKYSGLARSLRETLGPPGPDISSLPAQGQPGQAMPLVQPEGPGNLPDDPDWPAHLITPPSDGERPPIPPASTPPQEAQPSSSPADSVVAQPKPTLPPPDPMSDLVTLFEGMPGARTGLLSIALQERGLVISIAGSILFEPGSATLKPDARAYLEQVSSKLVGVELPVMVHGTADEQAAANPQGFSPWDLAALRAGAVVRYLVEDQGLPGNQFVTVGYGSDGDSNAGRLVTIVVMRKADAY